MKNKVKVGRLVWILACCVLLVLAGPPPARAQDSTDQTDKWQFEFTPYFMAVSLNGDVGARGLTGDVDMSFSDFLDDLEAGFLAAFEARKGPWIFLFDAIYFKLKTDETKSWQGPFGFVSVTGAVEVTPAMQTYQPSVGYRLMDDNTKLDLIGAVRYTRVDVDLDLVVTTAGIIFPGGARSLSRKEDWWDPVIGARLMTPFSEKWSFFGYADLGGFGVGSDFTFQGIVGIKWQFSKVVSAKLAYRYLYQDYTEDDFVWDMAAHGPLLGFGFRF